VDAADPARGLMFRGRVAEDFKLSSGTWVRVGPLRTAFLAHCDGLAQDVVFAGLDRGFIAALIVPALAACRALVGEGDGPQAALVHHATVRAAFADRLRRFSCGQTGSATRIERAILLDEPLSLDAREITDKGTVNQRAVLEHRDALVEALYAAAPGPDIIDIGDGRPS
jgi:feruloyl-CoA synthase